MNRSVDNKTINDGRNSSTPIQLTENTVAFGGASHTPKVSKSHTGFGSAALHEGSGPEMLQNRQSFSQGSLTGQGLFASRQLIKAQGVDTNTLQRVNESNLDLPRNMEATKLHHSNSILSKTNTKIPEMSEAPFNVDTHKSGDSGNLESNVNLSNAQSSRLVNQGFGNVEMIGRFNGGDGMFDHGGSSNGDAVASGNIDGNLFFDDGDYAATGPAGAPELEF